MSPGAQELHDLYNSVIAARRAAVHINGLYEDVSKGIAKGLGQAPMQLYADRFWALSAELAKFSEAQSQIADGLDSVRSPVSIGTTCQQPTEPTQPTLTARSPALWNVRGLLCGDPQPTTVAETEV